MSDDKVSILKVVELPKSKNSEEMATKLSALSELASLGKLEYVMYVMMRPDGSWATGQAGFIGDPLRLIGLLESLKSDILSSAEQAASGDPDLAS